jgi:hypothetical protein
VHILEADRLEEGVAGVEDVAGKFLNAQSLLTSLGKKLKDISVVIQNDNG